MLAASRATSRWLAPSSMAMGARGNAHSRIASQPPMSRWPTESTMSSTLCLARTVSWYRRALLFWKAGDLDLDLRLQCQLRDMPRTPIISITSLTRDSRDKRDECRDQPRQGCAHSRSHCQHHSKSQGTTFTGSQDLVLLVFLPPSLLHFTIFVLKCYDLTTSSHM